MFSAVALVAFSFAGMANNEGKEELIFLEKEKDCFDQAIALMELVDALTGYTADEQTLTDTLNYGIATFCYGQGSVDLTLN